MRLAIVAAVLVLLAACGQAPVKPAPAQAAPPPAAAPTPPPPPPPPAYPPLAAPKQVPQDKTHPLVLMETNLGNITLQLDAERAPLSVANFLHYVNAHFYDNTSFYRIVPGFVIQAGDYTADYKVKPDGKPIANEAGNGFSNGRGTIAMARDTPPHTATSAFYINLVDNHRLDPRGDRWGYAVFGVVVDGMDVVDKIAAVPNGPKKLPNGYSFDNLPQTPVTIVRMTELPLPKP